jgi:hypothetical protein
MRGAGLALAALAPGSPLATLDTPALLSERAAIGGLTRQGTTTAGGSGRLIAARHGHLALNLPRDDDWRLLPAWLETEIGIERPRWDAIANLIASREVDALVERGRLMGLAVADAPERPLANRPLFTASHVTTRPKRPASRPVRLLDLSTLWAGPLASSLLAMAGFEVLKIESPERPDGARKGPRPFFDLMNGGKGACTLDLRRAADCTSFERLLEGADVVLESARPRALSQLGFDASHWLKGAPGRIWASITGYGRAHEWIAFGDDAAVAAGLAFPPDEDGGKSRATPCFCADAIADPLTGLHAAATILAHWQAGRGGLLEFSLVDVAAASASVPDDELVLPIEASDRDWSLLDTGRPIPIAAPRVRRVTATAPPLVAANEALIRHWTTPC